MQSDPSREYARALESNAALLANAETRFSAQSREHSPALESATAPKWPEPLEDEAFHGLAGKIVRAIEPHSEADPAALLIQFLAAFGNAIGPSAYFNVESTAHHANIFAVLVGETAKGRKGTALGQIRCLLREVDPNWEHGRVVSGLSSGEGLIWAVRDPIERREPVRERGRVTDYQDVIVDQGITDKRLLVIEQEFSSPLRVMERHGTTLSPVLRDAWDTGSLFSLTKNSPARATGAHISVVGHVTRQELLRYLSATESANGFGNRFVWVSVRRSKCLPEGGALNADAMEPHIESLRNSVSFARGAGAMHRDEAARNMWKLVYPKLSEGFPGLLGSMTSRAESQVLRLSMIYALLDGSAVISPQHLKAALAVWDYCLASARYIFGDAMGLPEADEIMRALRATPEGLSRTELSALFGRHKTVAQIESALRALAEMGLAEALHIETEGRSAEVWRATRRGANKAKEAKQEGGLAQTAITE